LRRTKTVSECKRGVRREKLAWTAGSKNPTKRRELPAEVEDEGWDGGVHRTKKKRNE